ncbi:8858_t:CDS:1, partial [Gigaspora rosea]
TFGSIMPIEATTYRYGKGKGSENALEKNHYKERKKDTNSNDEIQDVKIFRCVDVEGKGFARRCY